MSNTVTSETISSKEAQVQASPISHPGLTPNKIYNATVETVEYTSVVNEQWGISTSISTGKIFVIIDDNNKIQRFGNEFFRIV